MEGILASVMIADVANIWTLHGNIRFDFGESSNGTFRQWVPNDDSHIRIGFDQAGYWSLVGTDSVDDRVVEKGEISLNLQDFDRALPPTVLG